MKFLATDGAPKAIGPYSQAVVEAAAVRVGPDPARPCDRGARRRPSSLRRADLRQPCRPSSAEAGLGFSDVVKMTVYLTRSEDFPPMNAVYARRFGDHRPARSTVIVAALPKGAPLEIDLIARVKP